MHLLAEYYFCLFAFFCHGVILLIEANEPMRSVSESFRNTHLETLVIEYFQSEVANLQSKT